MVVVSGTQRAMSLNLRGSFGFSAAAGFARCGKVRCGASKEFGGVYRKKMTARGWGVSRARFPRWVNPQTTNQQAWRSTFAVGITAWHALTSDEKNAYNKEAKRYRLSGLTLFMRRYLQANRA